MKRYAISTILGDGTEDNSYRPAVAEFPCNWNIAIAPDQTTNTSKQWVLAVVAATQATFTAMNGAANITVLVFGPDNLAQTWLSLGTNQTRQAYASNITNRTGVTVTRDDPRSLREIVTAIGLAVDANFNPANMTIPEWTGA